MVDIERKNKIEEFVAYWKDKGYEKGESQKFWLSLLRDVYGLEQPEKYINFEDKVHLDHTSFIDGMIPATKVMIEQKSAGKNLRKEIRQSDGTYKTPFKQAKSYIAELPLSKHPRWVITCNFREFLVYDMEKPDGEPEEIFLENLPTEYYRLSFLADEEKIHVQKEKDVSIEAGKIVSRIYDALYKQYRNSNNPNTLKSLNKLCVRIVFCLYAEDAGIFGKHKMFHDYMAQFDLKSWRDELIKLFKVLNTKIEEREDMYLDDDLSAFPYVNGGLFADEDIEIPRITDEIRYMILTYGSEQFNWSQISPTIFGAIFESTLNPSTRRERGMHYTSIETIHKVIDPLFLNDLYREFETICEYKYAKVLDKKLIEFQNKIAGITFMDPACGSGNFITEAYISLRRLENKIIQKYMMMRNTAGQIIFGDFEIINPIKVSISQFYGIEINDFAVSVAQTALWIAESQMMKETEEIVHMTLDFLPLKTNANIVEGNALEIDWENVVKPCRLNYIMGNPPFVGQALRSKEQSEDMKYIFGKGAAETKLDYVLCWYKKALIYMKKNIDIKCAYVSTNSICQGESVPTFWKNFSAEGAEIQFAYTDFEWTNEARKNATVYCVIVGFTAERTCDEKVLFTNGEVRKTEHINGYLVAAPDVWIISRKKTGNPRIPQIEKGSEPVDGGNLFLSFAEKEDMERKHPKLKNNIRPFIGAVEMLKNKQNSFSRYCLWFDEGVPDECIKIRELNRRLQHITELRNSSTSDRIRKKADYPYMFCQKRQPSQNYIAIPRHTSSSRKYIPISYVDKNIICGDSIYTIESNSICLFGILNSFVHNVWTRAICGRLGMGYRYSPVVYNNFPWPDMTHQQQQKIEKTAKGILDARLLFSESSLADLYNEKTMRVELRDAHRKNDIAVLEAYGFAIDIKEEDCAAELMKLYMKQSIE